MVKTKHKNRLDANIIEFLMLDPDSETTASNIALGIGLKSAKDVTNRLTVLHKQNIINRFKRGKRVYWSIESTDTNTHIELDLTIPQDGESTDTDGGNSNANTTPIETESEENVSEKVKTDYYTDLPQLLINNLTATVEHLHTELNFLREELRFKNREMNDFFVYHDYNNGVPLINKTHPSDQIPSHGISYVTCPSCRSWSTVSNGHAMTSPKAPMDPYVLTTPRIESAETPLVRNHETPRYESIWSPVSSKHTCSPVKPSELNPPSILSENRFEVLSSVADGDDVESIAEEVHQPTPEECSGNIVTPVTKSPRSSLFVNNHPENQKFVAKSQQSVRKKPCIALVGDSMVKNITSFKIRSILNNVDCYVRPNLGAEVEDIMDKLRPDIKKRKTDIVVLHVGVNDCKNDNYCLRDTIFKYELLLDWLDSQGVIAIVSLNIFTDNNLINYRVRNINRELVDLCIRKNVNYISNANITRDHLYERGSHLNSSGSDILCKNICDFLNFLIPYVYPN